MAKGDHAQSIPDRVLRRSSSDKGADDPDASDSSGTVTADEGDAIATDDGLGPHEVRIDDPASHGEPTEVDID
ncbi:MAG: hypothetical protein ACR2IR_01755 [Acidimicrobiia bacterium]